MEENLVLELLKELHQEHIIIKYKLSTKKEQQDFISQINKLDKVCRGGLKDYLKRAKILLEESKNKNNHFSDTTIEIPDNILFIEIGIPLFFELEKIGFEELKDTGFVLVAGGLGERLGYSDKNWITN